MVFELYLSQLITCPTQFHGNILNLLLTTNEDLISNINVQSSVWKIIKSVISDAMTQFTPKFQFHSRQYPIWFTKELRHQLKRLHTLGRNHKHSPSAHIVTQLAYTKLKKNSNIMLLQPNLLMNLPSLTSMPLLLIQPFTTTLEPSQNQGQPHLQCILTTL